MGTHVGALARKAFAVIKLRRKPRIELLLLDVADLSLIVACAKPYLSVTAFDADPPKLLRTVMFFGLIGHDN